MHYIIGAQFQVPVATNRVHTGVTQLSRGPEPTIQGKYKSMFKPGITYSLFNIKPTKDKKYDYAFTGDVVGEAVVLTFNSPGEGDEFIAAARGEQLPDYNRFYSNRN